MSFSFGHTLPRSVTPAAGGSDWTPNSLTPGATTTWWAFDAEAPMYQEMTGTPSTLASAHGDRIGTWPCMRQDEIAGYAFKYLRAYGNTASYRAELKTNDATHPRVVGNVGGSDPTIMTPEGALGNWYRGANPSIYAFRAKLGSASGSWIPLCVDYSPFYGPGIGVYGNYLQYDPSGISGGISSGIELTTMANNWLSVVMTASNSDGVKIYINDPVTPAFSAAGAPGEIYNRAILTGVENANYALRRVLVGSNYDTAQASVAQVMDWLSRPV